MTEHNYTTEVIASITQLTKLIKGQKILIQTSSSYYLKATPQATKQLITTILHNNTSRITATKSNLSPNLIWIDFKLPS